MFNSRAKGARGELEVARLLQAWWSEIEPGVTFKRTPGSGGWAHGRARADFETSGDLVTTSDTFPWSVEIKLRENWVWSTLAAARPSPVWEWWLQAQTQAGECGKEPMMWFRKNRELWSVMVREDVGLRHVELHRHVFKRDELLEIDTGWRPVILRGDRLLATHPRLFLEGAGMKVG